MKEEINEIVAFLQNPNAFQEMGARAPRVWHFIIYDPILDTVLCLVCSLIMWVTCLLLVTCIFMTTNTFPYFTYKHS